MTTAISSSMSFPLASFIYIAAALTGLNWGRSLHGTRQRTNTEEDTEMLAKK